MATPYQFSPRIPVPPHPTPLSVTAYRSHPDLKAKRPPIHNPYDKFTQPEFDAWIGDITGALKRALGQIEADDEPKASECTQEASTRNAMIRYRLLDPDESEDEALDDSFAEIKARRLLGKGKARDPREGPGLGGTDRTKPIEIVSSDEEEEYEVELAIGVGDGENEDEEEDEEDDYSEQEEDYSWNQGQSSSQQIFSPVRRRRYIQDEFIEDDSEEDSEEEEDSTPKSTEVINIVSEDEDEMDDNGQDKVRQEKEDWGTEVLEEGSDEEYYEGEEQIRLGTTHLKFHAAQIRTSRDSSQSHYTDKEGTEDRPEIVEDDDDEVQPPEANTAFPSQKFHSPARAHSPIEIPDPWAGPRVYAEDHYKGGDVRLLPGTRPDANHLGDNDSCEEDVTNAKLDGGEIQVAEQDTSSPLHGEDQERLVDVPGPWVGSQTYTKDFYAAAYTRTHPGQKIDPSFSEGIMRVPSALQTVTPGGQDYEEDPIDDEEQAEDEPEHDEEAVIQPPTQHTFAPTSRLARRALPIPANAEFISIDDSDEETGLGDQESITLEPLDVVEMEFQELQNEDVDKQNMEREQSVETDEIVKQDTTYMHKPILPPGSAPPSEADVPITTSLPSYSDQQDCISMNYESLYGNIEAGRVQSEEQDDVISTSVVDWNHPPAFPAGIPTSAPGHLATPSSEESSANGEGSAVQAPSTLITSLESVDKESSSYSLVHEEVTTHAEKDLDKVLVDQATLSIPEPALVEDSEPQSTFQTLTADLSSSSPTLSDVVVNDTQVAKHGEGVMAEEPAQRHKIDVEITSEDVTQLNESAPAQQSPESNVDHEVESKGVDTSMQESEIMSVNSPPVSVVLNSRVAAANAEDDISPFAEGVDEQIDNQSQPSASTSSVQIPVQVYHSHHVYDYDQLPTPPPDRSPTIQSPLVANDGSSNTLTSPPRRHAVQIEEVEDEDDVRPQPFSADSPELGLRIDIECEPYTVVEPEPTEEYIDEDADGDGEIDFDVEVISMNSASQIWDEALNGDGEMQFPLNYVVEEPLTDGRLTEEPEDPVSSLGVIGVEAEENEAHAGVIQNVPFSTVEEPVPLDREISLRVDMNIQPQSPSNHDPEEPTGTRGLPTSAAHATLESTFTVEHGVPMPVTANADVVDPTSCPDTPSHLSASFVSAAPDVLPQAQRQAPDDGLFTPAEESTTVTPASIHGQALEELAHAFFEIPSVSSTPVEGLAPMSNADLSADIDLGNDQSIEQTEVPLQLPPIGAEAMHISGAQHSGNIHAKSSHNDSISTPSPSAPPASIHVTLTRKPTDPILVSDPYPYSLSTPGVGLMDPIEEDSEQDNSMSSNSTWEKDMEDKDTNSILDDADEPEFQYPPEPDVSAELNVRATAKDEEAKVVDEAADVDARRDFGPESVVALLPQTSAQIQPADPPMAPGLISGIEENDVSPREILPIEPPKGISPRDFPLIETADLDLPEQSTTPPNGIAKTFASTRASKRKRDLSQLPLENVAPATTDKAEKGKNKKVSKLAGKGKAKATNQEVIDQVTSQATIHVKPRRKAQSMETRALPKNPSEVWTAGRSSSGAGATYRMLLSSSRSSSVASSDQSVAILPSPTVHKPNVPHVQTSLQPVSLFHAHGQKRNNQNNQPQLSQTRTHPIQSPMPSIQRVISSPRITDSCSSATSSTAAISPTTTISPTVLASPTRATPSVIKAVPPPAIRHAPAISSSPVTRSHCRYHRISLPKEEGGPRLCFLVPGCSLNDRELMAAEEIEDHGDATHEDSLRMIKDIQSLDFDSYLIGILRQLVGLDILREQEVFYLPQPGEEIVRKTSPRKERSGVFRGVDSSSSPGYSGSIRSPASMKAPTSLADSTSTSLSAFRRRMDSEKGSSPVHSDQESELSDGEPPDAKRARPSPPDEQQGGAGPMGPPLKNQGKRQPKGRRSKQSEEMHQGNSDSAQSHTTRENPSKLGNKRRRGSEITAKDNGEERVSKKLKTHPSTQPLAVGDSTT